MKRLLSLIIAFTLLLSTFVPYCFSDYSSQPRTFWDKFLYKTCELGSSLSAGVDVDGFTVSVPVGSLNGWFNSHLSSEICASSSDNLHHADSIKPGSFSIGFDGKGKALCTCKYCGHDFVYRSDDLQQDYNNYIHDSGLDDGPVAPTQVPSGGFPYTGHWKSDCPYLVSGPASNDIICSFVNGSWTKNLSGSYLCFGLYMPNATYKVNCLYILDNYTIALNNDVYSSFSLYFNGKFRFVFFCPSSNRSDYPMTSGITPLVVDYFSGDNDTGYGASDFARSMFHEYVSKYYVFDSIGYPSNYVPSTITFNDTDYNVTSYNFTTRTFVLQGNKKIEYGDTQIN